MWWRISFIPSPFSCCWSFRLPLLGNPSSLIFSLFPRGVTHGLGWIRLKLSWLTKRNKTEFATGSLLEEELCALLTLYSLHMYYLHDPNLYPMKNSPLHFNAHAMWESGIPGPSPSSIPDFLCGKGSHAPLLWALMPSSIKQGPSKASVHFIPLFPNLPNEISPVLVSTFITKYKCSQKLSVIYHIVWSTNS